MNPELMAFLVVLVVMVSVGGGTAIMLARRRLNPLAVDRKMGWPPYIERDGTAPFLGWAGSVLSVFLALALVTGFAWYLMAPTWEEVFNRYADRIDLMEDRFRRISSLLPQAGSVRQTRVSGELDPVPIYDGARNVFNTEIISASRLREPIQRETEDELYLGQHLSLLIYWRHQPPFITDDKASRHMAKDIEQALGCRYLVVYRSAPLAAEFRQRTDGDQPVAVEAFLFDLESTERKCDVLVMARDWSSAAQELLRELRAATRGTFVKGSL
jgi:hypothetical protein